MKEDLENLLICLDGSGSDQEHDAVSKLRGAVEDFPSLLLEKYSRSKKWGERVSCVYHSIPYARTSESAFELGLKALMDKSKVVRYRACMLLAYSLRADAIEYLMKLKGNENTGEFAVAAIDAIQSQNHHYFVDREHSGMMLLNVQN